MLEYIQYLPYYLLIGFLIGVTGRIIIGIQNPKQIPTYGILIKIGLLCAIAWPLAILSFIWFLIENYIVKSKWFNKNVW